MKYILKYIKKHLKKKRHIFEKSFTLIELLVVIAIISILLTVVLIVLNSGKDKAKIASATRTVNSIMPIIESCAMENNCGVSAPLNPSTGGGPIVTTGSDIPDWPSLQKSGYSYNVSADNNITDGNFTFSLTRADTPTVEATLSNFVRSINVITASSLPVSPCPPYGDVNNDGHLTTGARNLNEMIEDGDVVRIELHTNGSIPLSPEMALRADVNANGSINGTDALWVNAFIDGLQPTFPVCNL